MTTRPRILAAALSIAALGALTLTAGPADAADPRARVTASASDTTPASGQQFVITGRVTGPLGNGRAGVVRIQTLRGGTYVDLAGARVATDSDGDYRVRVVLAQAGDRVLRVVANPAGSDLRNAHRRLAVDVH